MFNLTPVVRNLIIINVVVFILQSLLPLVEYLALYNVRTQYFKTLPVVYVHVLSWRLFPYFLQYAGAEFYGTCNGRILGTEKISHILYHLPGRRRNFQYPDGYVFRSRHFFCHDRGFWRCIWRYDCFWYYLSKHGIKIDAPADIFQSQIYGYGAGKYCDIFRIQNSAG
jgi:hypothetical protein